MKKISHTCGFSPTRRKNIWSARRTLTLNRLCREYLQERHRKVYDRLLKKAELLISVDRRIERESMTNGQS